MLPTQHLTEILAEEVGSYRERTYPPLTTLGLFIGQALSPDGACQDAVSRHLSERIALGSKACSLSTGPYCKARQRLPLALITRLATTVSQRLESAIPANWLWRGRAVKLVDGTTLSMPDTAANQACYPQSGVQAVGLGFPLAMLVALISLSTGAVLRWATGPCRGKGTGEQALFRELMPHLAMGDIILADRFYCNYFALAMLAERGVDMVTRQHQSRITDFSKGQCLGQYDQLMTWTRPHRPTWMDEATYARMPKTMTVRETKVAGRILVSTLTDAVAVTPSDLDALYGQRWQVEVDLRSIKAVMGMDILRAKSPAMIDKEIAVYILAYNLVCALIARAAAGAMLMARALSFKATLQLLLAFQQQMRWAGRRAATSLCARLLSAIGSMKLPSRPDRIEPRAIKRRPKNHALLTVPRNVAREKIVKSRAEWLKVVP